MKTFQSAEEANHLVWDGKTGHYENYYITFNHRSDGAGFWLRYTMLSPKEGGGEPTAHVWFGYFDPKDPARNFGLVQDFPASAMVGGTRPFELRIGDSALSHGGARGSIRGHGHEVSWDVNYTPCDKPHLPLPALTYVLPLFQTTLLCPNPLVLLNGNVAVDGKTYAFENEPAGQTHYWGRKMAHRWAWGRCANFQDSPGTLVEAMSVQLEHFGKTTPDIHFVTVRHGGKEHRFAEPLQLPFCGGRFDLGRWTFHASSADTRFECEITAPVAALITAHYTDPDGDPAYCDNTETATCELKIFRRKNMFSPWKIEETLRSDGLAHVEFAGRKLDPRVSRRIEVV